MGGRTEREVIFLPNERGYARIFVTEANGAIPVEGAFVTVTDYGAENDVLYTLRTDEGGLTETVSLRVPDAGASLNPGSEAPAGYYGVTVRRAGYYPVEAVSVPVFSGVLAVLPVDLVRLISNNKVSVKTPGTGSLEPGGVWREDVGNRNGEITGGDLSNRPTQNPGPQNGGEGGRA